MWAALTLWLHSFPTAALSGHEMKLCLLRTYKESQSVTLIYLFIFNIVLTNTSGAHPHITHVLPRLFLAVDLGVRVYYQCREEESLA